jgi:hypothetical protein
LAENHQPVAARQHLHQVADLFSRALHVFYIHSFIFMKLIRPSVNCHVWSLRPISCGDRPVRTPGRPWQTRAGAVKLRIPKLRKGSYFPGFAETRRTAKCL